MAAAVDDALEHNRKLFVEAGTGTGKSFAYLLPVIKRIIERRERVVICTNTIASASSLVSSIWPSFTSTEVKKKWGGKCRIYIPDTNKLQFIKYVFWQKDTDPTPFSCARRRCRSGPGGRSFASLWSRGVPGRCGAAPAQR